MIEENAYPKTWSVYPSQTKKVKELAAKIGISEGAVVQFAIDAYYSEHINSFRGGPEPSQAASTTEQV